jgi:transforming growth factor-beta-induced protein
VDNAFIPHLRAFLTYHLLNVELFAADFTDGQVLTAVNTEIITVTWEPVSVNGVPFSVPDNDVTNGVVHIINAATLEANWVTNTIVDKLAADDEFSTLVELLGLAGIALNQTGAFTLLAPTNDAFDALGQDVLDFLKDPENIADLGSILTYHVLPGVFSSLTLTIGQQIPTFEGRAVTVNGNPFRFNNATVKEFDFLANNGLIFKLESVLDFPLTIFSFLESEADTTVLFTAIQRGGFEAGLSGPGGFTLFAPTDDVFAALPPDLAELLLVNDEFIPHLQVFLLNHLLGVERFTTDFVAGDISSLAGELLTITLNPLRVNGASFSSGDNDVANGVVHKIDGALSPSWVSNSIEDRVIADATISMLLMLVTLADIDLSVPGEFTLLAPTNAAFGNLTEGTLEFLTDPANIDELVTLLTYHVVAGVFTAAELVAGNLLRTVLGRVVTVVSVDPVIFNNATVGAIDILANNGVLYKINAVLELPPAAILNVVIEDPELSTLETAIFRSGFSGPLLNLGPFTLFAPTNDAFALVPGALADILLNDDEYIPHLQSLLLYHLLNGEFGSDDLVAGSVGTLNGESVTIGLNPITVNGNLVSTTDIGAVNGVVHKLDGVLEPFWVQNTLTNRLRIDPQLSTWASLIEVSGITVLDTPFVAGGITLLAPTNFAFAFLPPTFLELLLNPANQAVLIRLIQYNIVPGVVTVPELPLPAGGNVVTLEGNTIAVSTGTDGNTIFFNTATVTGPPLLANNGIFYKVDALLQPPNLRIFDDVDGRLGRDSDSSVDTVSSALGGYYYTDGDGV